MSRLDFGHIPITECNEPLVRLTDREFLLEPKYFEWKVSPIAEMYLREGVVQRLLSAKKELPKGYTFKLWDCFRPLAVQQALFEQCKSDVAAKHPTWTAEQIYQEARKFIAVPDKAGEIPPHNTGGTVDLTLVNDDGEELNMGTDFDEFSECAHPLYFHELSGRSVEEEAIIRNRDMLTSAMVSAGFRPDTDEWWHFDYGNQLWALETGKPAAIYGSAEPLLRKS